MRRRYRLRSRALASAAARDEERYMDAIDEARENVRLASRDYHDALDALEELVDPEGLEEDASRPDFYERRRRGP